MRNKDKKIESKTTTVGIRLEDHVILAADKRATAGVHIAHKNVNKIQFVDDRIALTMSGLVADAQMLVEIARFTKRYLETQAGARVYVRSIASYLATLISSYSRILPYIVQLLLAGYDTAPRLYYIDLFGTVVEEDYMATGSGSPIAYGVLERGYRPGMAVADAVELAVEAVKAAASRDAWSGEGVDVVVIGPEGSSKKTVYWRKH